MFIIPVVCKNLIIAFFKDNSTTPHELILFYQLYVLLLQIKMQHEQFKKIL